MLNYFTSAYVDYVFPEQAPGTKLIDKAVIDGALNYIVRNQGRQGQLPIVGRVHNFGLLVCAKLTHTCMCTHTFTQCVVHISHIISNTSLSALSPKLVKAMGIWLLLQQLTVCAKSNCSVLSEFVCFHFLSSEMMASLPTLPLDFSLSSSMWRPLRVMRVPPLHWYIYMLKFCASAVFGMHSCTIKVLVSTDNYIFVVLAHHHVDFSVHSLDMGNNCITSTSYRGLPGLPSPEQSNICCTNMVKKISATMV